MFQSQQHIARRQGKNALSRFEYIQRLVTEFQDTSDIKVQQQVLANICNFSYDPINYDHLRALNVIPDLFLDAIIEEDPLLVRFGLGGIANSCSDATNTSLVIESEGIALIIDCLSNTDSESISNALSSLIAIFLVAPTLSPTLIDTIINSFPSSAIESIEAYAESELPIINNLARVCLDSHSAITKLCKTEEPSEYLPQSMHQ